MADPKKEEVKNFIIQETTVNNLLKYLATKPFGEVAGLIQNMNLTPIPVAPTKPAKPAAAPPAPTADEVIDAEKIN